MCLIVAKPAGVVMPSKGKLKEWFKGHPDGFGLAYLYEEEVRIVKGAMSSKKVNKLVKRVKQDLKGVSLDSLDVILHFRQASDGAVEPKNCHPFPITNNEGDLSALDTKADIALVHNGIIFDYSTYYKGNWTYPATGKTDTQEFIEDYLVGIGDSIWNPSVQALIGAYTDSKFALLSSKGIALIGEFIGDGGLMYSNGGYKAMKPTLVVKHTPTNSLPKLPYEGNEEDYSYEPNLICEFCEQRVAKLYWLPEGDSLVCEGCFTALEGRKPDEDLVY